MPLPSASATPGVSVQGTILIIEDEPSISLLAKQVLERAGFGILLATDGQEGIDLFTASGKEILIVLLDLTMPGMDGREALQEIRRLDPYVPVLLMSGLDEGEMVEEFQGQGVSCVLSKPFGPRQLLQKVSVALGMDLLPPNSGEQ